MSTLEERLDRIERLLLIQGKEVLNTEEAAAYMGRSQSWVYHAACDRTIPHYKNGKMLSFRKSELDSWRLRDRILTNEELAAKVRSERRR